MDDLSEDKKILPEGVKEPIKEQSIFRPRTTLKRWIFVNKGLSYASVRDLLKERKNIDTTRQYIYGICSGRLTPSLEFAKNLCEVLGIENVFYFFEPTEFPILEKYKEDENGKN